MTPATAPAPKLADLLDRVLISLLPDGTLRAVDDCLAGGLSPEDVLDLFPPARACALARAVQTYLARREAERAAKGEAPF